METPLQILIQGCRRQDSDSSRMQSQQQLYRHFYPDMIKICYRYGGDADSAGIIYNNAMLRVFKNLDSYSEEGKLGGWIKAIVVNCCIDFCKKKNIFKNAAPYIAAEEVVIEPDAFDRVGYKEVLAVVNELPGATATVFKLFVFDGFTHKQIAEQLNISEGTSKWHVSEAKKLLKRKFEKQWVMRKAI